MSYDPGGYQGVPTQREFRPAATGRPLQWERSDRPAALAAYLNIAFRSMLAPRQVGSDVPNSERTINAGPRHLFRNGTVRGARENRSVEVVASGVGRQNNGR